MQHCFCNDSATVSVTKVCTNHHGHFNLDFFGTDHTYKINVLTLLLGLTTMSIWIELRHSK